MSKSNSNQVSQARQRLMHQLWELNVATDKIDPVLIRTRLVLIFCLLSLSVNLIYATVTATSGNFQELLVSVLTLLLIATVFISVWRRGWQRWSAHLYLFSSVLSLALYLVVHREIHASITVWIPFIPMLAMLLLDTRDGAWATLAAVVTLLAVAFGVDHHIHNTPLLETTVRLGPTLFSIALASAATLGVLLVYVHQRDIIGAREKREREARATLLNILCHDISNQLTVIRFNAQTAENTDDREVVKPAVGQIMQANESIVEMVEAVRAMRALQDGKLAVNLTPVNAHQAIRDAVERVQPRFNLKGVTLRAHIPETEAPVWAENISLVQTVLGNLLTNALKFTPAGRATFIETHGSDDALAIIVRDEGVGIPDDVRPHLFDAGKHTSRPGTQGEAGTGFGLPLVKQMVEHYGGTITVETSDQPPNTGTTFTVSLRRANTPPPI